VKLPPGYYVDWSGRWENQERARQRLQIVLPIVLLIIFTLLYFTYHSVAEAAHVLLAVPFALTGGVYLLWLLGYTFSVAVWVGFIALFGVADDCSVVMLSFLEEKFKGQAPRDVHEVREMVIEAALTRVRPLLMTTATTVFGLLPIFLTQGRGSDVMQPMAIPMIGGMAVQLIAFLLAPCLYALVMEWKLRPTKSDPS
jgi:Cu(I)/Ag(I) efflux system membrane protein CusA/SilA